MPKKSKKNITEIFFESITFSTSLSGFTSIQVGSRFYVIVGLYSILGTVTFPTTLSASTHKPRQF